MSSPPLQSSLSDAKRSLRIRFRENRRLIRQTMGQSIGIRLADAFFASPLISWGPCPVAGYWPIGDEADILPLLTRLSLLGWQSLLPAVIHQDGPLIFRSWNPGDSLEKGPYGTRHPFAARQEHIPKMLLMPLLAFDDKGNRLGYGGGYYDRTLENLRNEGECVAVGVAFAAQRVNQIPCDSYDQPLDWIVTENGGKETKR